jgi:hypothetical protein
MDTASKPATLSDKVINGIREGCDKDGFYVLKKFIIGQSVRIEKGVLTGHVGIFDGQLPRERVAVLIEMLGSTVRASVREDDVVAA